jgi:hypothetical protein
MNLAAILGIYLLSVGSLSPGALPPPAGRGVAPQSTGHPSAPTSSDPSTQQSQPDASASQPQAPPAQGAEPAQPAPSPTGQTPNSPGQAKPSTTKRRHHKKTIPPNCSDPPTAPNPAAGNPADSTNSAGAGSTNAGSNNAGSNNAGSTSGGSSALPPCAPPRKVVRNGGSKEPAIQLVEGTTAEQVVHQRSTDQLTVATEENLKKIAGRQLNPSQQEMVSQIKQFMEQSKTAVAAGDLERGHNLALKAHLLSDELVKP